MIAVLQTIRARASAKEEADRQRIEEAAGRLLEERARAMRRAELEAQIAAAEAALAELKALTRA